MLANFHNGVVLGIPLIKYEFRNFLASITVGESRDITQATIGSIHFPAIYYFALFIGRCINAKDEACHMCVPDLSILRSAVFRRPILSFGSHCSSQVAS